jgi:hypothetical protein
MGVNSVLLAWLDHLEQKGAFAGCSSIFELGPQDWFFPREQLKHVARMRLPENDLERAIDSVFNPDGDGAFRQRSFYRLFGFDRYSSCDALDWRAEFKIDLNLPAPLTERYDCVTNFGTSEHVFNIGQVFATVHCLLSPGGIALHALPVFGDIDHGFYNVHPVLYFDIARANSYDVLDIRYVDNMNLRALRQAADPATDELATLAVDLRAEWSQIGLSRRLSDLYADNVASPGTREMLGADPAAYVVDYCFVALRKPLRETAFAMPMQSSTAGWIHSSERPS